MQQFTFYNGTEQLEFYCDTELGYVAKICSNRNEVFLLTTGHDLYTGTIDLNEKQQQQIIHLNHLRPTIIDIECSADSLYVVHQNGCVYRKYLIDLPQTNEWQEIVVPNPKLCVHGYRSSTDKVLIAQINCNNDGVLFTTLKRELYAMGNFGDVVRSECPVPVECFSGFKIIQVTTGEHFVVVLTHKKPHIDVDDFNSEESSTDSAVFLNSECPQCAPNSGFRLNDSVYKSTTETSIASSVSQSDVFELDSGSIVTVDQTESVSGAVSHKDGALNFLLESLSIASEDAGKKTTLLKENVSNLTSMVRERVRTLSRHMSGSSDNDPPGCANVTQDTFDDKSLVSLATASEIDYTRVDGPESFCEDLSLDIESAVDLQYEYDIDKNVSKLCRLGAGLLSTSVWGFGSVNKGHLGTGDHIKRTRINPVLGLTGQGVMKICSGREHSVALTLDGRLFVWGNNNHQQIHATTDIEDFSAPRRHRNQQNTLDAICGDYSTYILSNDLHTKELRPKTTRDDNRAKTFITLKLNKQTLPPDRQSKIPLFLASGNFYVQNHIRIGIIEKHLSAEQKCLQHTLIAYVSVVKPFLKKIYLIPQPKNHVFDQLCHQYLNILNLIAVNVNTMREYYAGVTTNFTNILCVKSATEMIAAYRTYVRCFCDVTCVHGLDTINTMLDKDNKHKDRTKVFERPLLSIWNYIELITDLLSVNEEKSSVDIQDVRKMLNDRKTEWERFRSEKDLAIEAAEKTSRFWSAVGKNPMGKLQTADRRLVLDSKVVSLKLYPSGRFSSHWFVLFSDIFCHFSNSLNSYHLKTVWTSPIVDQDTIKHSFKVITPEKHFVLQAIDHESKLIWLDGMERRIKDCLDKPNFAKMPQYRNASYTFGEKNTKYPGGKYFGRWYVGQMHGIGHLEYVDGRVYNGQMTHGEVQGFGRMFTPGIGIYEGDFVAGKYHGYGVLEMRNRGTYEGNFKDGMQHGHGVLRADQFTYIGEFRNDMMHGYGVLDNAITGDKYLGMFSENKKNGHGISITMDGNYFEGNFVADKLCGHGVAVFDNGSYYEGDLTFGGPDGKGTLFLPCSEIKNENLECEVPTIEMAGNILSGTLSGTWKDVKINYGNIAMNQCFPIFPKSLGGLAIDDTEKWKSLFVDWEYEVFGLDFDTWSDCKQCWNKVAIYITNTKRRQNLKSEGFSEKNKGPWSSTDQLVTHEKEKPITNLPESYDNISVASSTSLLKKLSDKSSLTSKIHEFIAEANSLSNNNHNHSNLVVHNEIMYDNFKNETNLLDIFKLKKDATDSILRPQPQAYHHNSASASYDETQRRKSIIDNLDFVPDFGVTKLDKQDLVLVKDYLTKAFRDTSHPFGALNSRISFGFYTSYGCWKVKPKSILSTQAMHEWQHISTKIYGIVRKLFPALPAESDYCDGELISHQSLMYPILLSDGIYSTLFVLYASKCSRNDELYRQRVLLCDKKTDEELSVFLKMDRALLPLIKSTQFGDTLCCLKQVKEKNCPREMLNQIESTFKLLNNAKNDVLGKFNMLNADNIMPLTIFLILRAGIPHLGAEILLLEDLMGAEFEPVMLGFAGYCFATIKATYQHILGDKFLQD